MKDAPFVWTEDCESAFRQLKRALTKPPILIYHDGQKRFKLYIDSSHDAVGACLMQDVNGRDRVVAYASKLLTGSQKNWISKQDGVSEIECWGVVWATRKFRCYLDKREFDLHTDHQALTWVFSPGNRTTNAKPARWAMELSSLPFKIHHKPSTTMGHVDGLSRLPSDTVAAIMMHWGVPRRRCSAYGSVSKVYCCQDEVATDVTNTFSCLWTTSRGGLRLAVTFVKVMVNGVVAGHGVPSRLLSDNGRNFTSEIATASYQTLGMKKLFGSAYHPKTHGLVERFNGTLMRMLKMHVSEARTDWGLYLSSVLFAYRTSYHEALGDTPFFSLYGWDLVLPLDVAFLNLGKKWESNEVAQYRRELHRSLRDSLKLVERQLLKAQARHERRLASQVEVSYDIGDPVWEVNVNRLKTYRERWAHPFMDEVPCGIVADGETMEDGTLEEADLPNSIFSERLSVGRGDSTFTGVDAPLLEVVAKRVANRGIEYLALATSYETFSLPREVLMSEYGVLVTDFEAAEIMKRWLPELRRSSR
ncbi:unnamed protein product [Phytophthora fragariaefolia]|uniref:Unnamed protein product n=1 Tax=Phytophthora fragariaefolia TaxID=1490495 RepID=A0A9W6TXH1_9STRA|nr:unnamed protein product [Phytophthora fragariaefolia]